MVSKEQKEKFLEELEKHGNIRVAAGASKINRSTIYRIRKRSKDFEKKMNRSTLLGKGDSCDAVEFVILKKALGGDINAGRFFLIYNSPRYKPLQKSQIDDMVKKETEKVKERYYSDGYSAAFKELCRIVSKDRVDKRESSSEEIPPEESVPNDGASSDENIAHLS